MQRYINRFLAELGMKPLEMVLRQCVLVQLAL